MTNQSAQAERFARARQEFAEAMERGCTILQLRELKAAERHALRQRAHAEVADHTATLSEREIVGKRGFIVIDEFFADPNFLAFDAPWMMRD